MTRVSVQSLIGVIAASLGLSGPIYAQSVPRDFALPTPLFAVNSPWNQNIVSVPVQAGSNQQILILYRVLRGDTTNLFPSGPAQTTWPFMDVNYDDYSIPICRMGVGQQTVLLRDYEGGDGGTNQAKIPVAPDGTVRVPAPAGTVRPAGPTGIDADGHLVLYNPDTGIAYDFWAATTARSGGDSLGGGIPGTAILEAGAIDFFDTQGSGANSPGFFSARATGPPLLAGLILPEDVESGSIDHALAFAIPGPRNTNAADPYEPFESDYFYPATTTEGDFFNTNPMALAAGQRIRMRQTLVDEDGNTIDENQLAPITRMYLQALRTYGAYLVDNAGGFTFYAEDIHTAVLQRTEAEVNILVGLSPGTPLPPGKTKWQVVIEKLNDDLTLIPFAHGPWVDGQDPSTASITTANFEVVNPASSSALVVTIDANKSDFSIGERLVASAAVDNTGGGGLADFYCGALLPDGDTIVYFRDLTMNSAVGFLSDVSTLAPMAPGVDLSSPFYASRPALVSYLWTGAEATGLYTLFLAAVEQGSFADGSVDAGDILALDTATFSFFR